MKDPDDVYIVDMAANGLDLRTFAAWARAWMIQAPGPRVRVRVRVRVRGGDYFLRLHTPFSIVGLVR